MGYIFISYSHKDSAYVERLAQALEKERFEIWIDNRIHYGSEWPKVVERYLDASDAVIVVLSKNPHESDMVQNEVARARDKKKPIFPLLLNGDNWLIVQTRQYVDVRDGSLPDEKFFERLTRVSPRNQKKFTPEPNPRAYTQPRFAFGSIVGLLLIILFIVGILNWGKIGNRTPTPDPLLNLPATAQPTVIQSSATTDNQNPTSTSVSLELNIIASSPTLTVTPASTQTLIPTPMDESCIEDIIFQTVGPMNDGIMLTFDAPFDITYSNMDNYRNVDLGDELRLLVYTTEYSNYTSGLYDKSRPNRLFIRTHLSPGLNIQLFLNQEGVTHCTKVIVIPRLIYPTHKPIPPTRIPVKG